MSETNPTERTVTILNIVAKITLAIGALLMFLAAIFPLEDGNLLVRGMMVLIPFFCASLLYALLRALSSMVDSLYQIAQQLKK